MPIVGTIVRLRGVISRWIVEEDHGGIVVIRKLYNGVPGDVYRSVSVQEVEVE